MPIPLLNRRDFLRQSVAFSALAALGTRSTFAAAPDPRAKHILMIGDWGRDGDLGSQQEVAAAMTTYAQRHSLHTKALLMLGDNWYGPLPGGIDDPRWKAQFEDLYPKAAFDCPAYAVLGNHDYERLPPRVSKVEAELAYARRGNTRWTQPHLWYTFNFPAHKPLLKVIALDSNVPKVAKNAVEFTMSQQSYAEQLSWFAAELASPRKAPFLVVMAHHPVFSNGPHGDHHALIRDWNPLLMQHKAHLYLAGHDHDLQHLEFSNHPTSFVCSGAGGADLYDLKIPPQTRGPFAGKVYGFTHLEVAKSRLTLRHVDSNGTVLHAFSKLKDGSVELLG